MLETMTTERGESIQDVDSLAQRLQQLDDNSQVICASSTSTANSQYLGGFSLDGNIAYELCRQQISSPAVAGHKINDEFRQKRAK